MERKPCNLARIYRYRIDKGYTVAPSPGLDMAKANLGIVFNELKK